MNTILVIIFTLGPLHGDGWHQTTWRRDLKTEKLCYEKLFEMKARKPSLHAKCISKKEAYNGKS